MEEHSCSPVMITPESVARMCGITVEEAEVALCEIPSTSYFNKLSTASGTKMNDER